MSARDRTSRPWCQRGVRVRRRWVIGCHGRRWRRKTSVQSKWDVRDLSPDVRVPVNMDPIGSTFVRAAVNTV